MQEFFQLKLTVGSRQVSLGPRHSSGLSKYSVTTGQDQLQMLNLDFQVNSSPDSSGYTSSK